MNGNNLHLPGEDSNDGGYDGRPYEGAAPETPRRRWPVAAAVVVLALAVVGGGVALAANMRSVDPAPAAASTAAVVEPTASTGPTVTPSTLVATSAAATPSASPASPAPATGTATAAVVNGRYVSPSAGVSFQLPDRWTAEESTDRPTGYPGTSIIVFNEARMQVAELYHGATGGVGGACGPGPYKMTELDTAPALDAPWAKARGVRFSYRVLDMRADGGDFDYQVGLVDNASGELKDSCVMYSFVSGAPKGTLSFADRTHQSQRHDDPIFRTMAEATDYLQSPEYKKLKAMILSLQMLD